MGTSDVGGAELSEVLTVTAPSLMRTNRIYGAEFFFSFFTLSPGGEGVGEWGVAR